MAPKPSAPTAAPKSGAFERVRLEPLPEHMYEEITAEQLVIDVAALSDFTEDEVRQTGVQNNLVALHLCGNVPEHRQDLLRLAQGLTVIRPTADPPMATAPPTGPAAIDAALGINVFSTGRAMAMQEQNTLLRMQLCRMRYRLLPCRVSRMVLNAVPWEARNLMNEPMVPHRLSRQ